MKILKNSIIVLLSGILLGGIAGCYNKEQTPVVKDPLVIPTVDVEHLQVNLPALPNFNNGEIKSEGNYDYIDLYELSDFHGAVDYCPSSENAYIGLPKMATYFNQRRAENPGGTLILSSGDMFQGSADSNSTRGFMVNYAMHYMGFDAMALGNHEFDWSAEWIKKNAELKYETHEIPYLGINILEKSTGNLPQFLKKSTIVQRGNYKIGIIGAMGNDLESSILYSSIKDFEFVDETELINAEALRLRSEEGCDIVVLLEHEAADKIPAVDGVDAIFGGHAHLNKTTTINGIPSVATKNYGRGIAHIQLKIDKNLGTVSSNLATVDVMTNAKCEALADDVGMKQILNQYAPAINSIKNIELGTAKDDLKLDGALKNICTKSMYDAAVEAAKGMEDIDESKILCAFHNVGGGIREDIKAGKITYGTVYTSFPFDNEVVLIKAKGTFLRNKLANFNNLGVYRLFVNKGDIDADSYYYIATTDFLALSEDSFNNATKFRTLTDADLIRTGGVVRDIVANRIYELDSLKTSDFPETDNYKNIPMGW